jgi:hypothetical protein
LPDHLAPLADAMVADPDQRLWLLQHTARRFGNEQLDPDGVEATSIVPQFFGDADTPVDSALRSGGMAGYSQSGSCA